MKTSQLAALIVVLLGIGGLIVAKSMRGAAPAPPAVTAVPTPPAEPGPTKAAASLPAATAGSTSPAASAPAATKSLPKLLELGSVGCVPCEHMAPIIDGLAQELKGKVHVEFIDVLKHPAVGEQHKVEVIPTQVFLAADGKELFRHVGIFEKPDILAKLRELQMLK